MGYDFWAAAVDLFTNPLFWELVIIGIFWRCYVVFPGFKKLCKKLFK